MPGDIRRLFPLQFNFGIHCSAKCIVQPPPDYTVNVTTDDAAYSAADSIAFRSTDDPTYSPTYSARGQPELLQWPARLYQP